MLPRMISASLPLAKHNARSYVRTVHIIKRGTILFKSATRRITSSLAGATKPMQQLSPVVREPFLRDLLLKPRTIPVPRWVSPQHFTATLSEFFGHSSFILVAISYAVDDFLNLRIIAVAGSSVMLLFTYFHPHGRVLWLPFKWNLLFILINSYRIGKVFLDRYLAEQLSPQLIQIRNDHFYILDPPDFARLVRVGKVETVKTGDVLVSQVSYRSE